MPALDRLAAMSGSSALQVAAIGLDGEAQRFAGPWTIEVGISPPGSVSAVVRSGTEPVAGVSVMVEAGGAAMGGLTDAAGVVHVDVGAPEGRLRIVATTPAPGPAMVYRGQPAWPDPQGAQTLGDLVERRT